MPLIHDNNKQALNIQDAQAVHDMIKGSLQSSIAQLEHLRTISGGTASEAYDPVINIYKESLDQLTNNMQRAMDGRLEIPTSQFIQNMYDGIAEKVLPTLDPESEYYPDLQGVLATGFGGMVYPRVYDDFGGMAPEERDDPAKYQDQVNDFHLADVPMEGVEDIAEYNPDSGSVMALYEGRSGNSNTLRPEWQKELQKAIEKAKDDDDRQAYDKNMEDLRKAQTSQFGLHSGAEYTRIRSSEMKNKEQVSFADVYETYTNINKMARPGSADAGVLRGAAISAGNVKGPGAGVIPQQTYQTLQIIADNINKIKQTKDPALQKTQAIQLASFAYQMTLSQHGFTDGNGRSSRLFADSILQTFGLPPHTPGKNMTQLTKTLGEEKMDFKKGAEVFLENVKKSDLKLKEDIGPLKERMASPKPEKKRGGREEEYSTKFSAIYEVNDDTVETLRQLKERTKKTSGRFHDSKEYKEFSKAVDVSYKLAQEIMKNKDSANFDMKKAEAQYSSSIRKILTSATAYKEYKMKDHVAEKSAATPEKKVLNEKDRAKMELMDDVAAQKNLIKVKKPDQAPRNMSM